MMAVVLPLLLLPLLLLRLLTIARGKHPFLLFLFKVVLYMISRILPLLPPLPLVLVLLLWYARLCPWEDLLPPPGIVIY